MQLKEYKRWQVKLSWSNGEIYTVSFFGFDPDSVLFDFAEDCMMYEKEGYGHTVQILSIKERPFETTK